MPVTLNDDKVWFDEARKFDHICADVLTAQESGHNVLLLSHFESSVSRIASFFREKGINHERFFSLIPAELCSSAQGKVWLGLARAFQLANEESSAGESSGLKIVVAEHHPMFSRDQEIIDAATQLASNAEITFYLSLDDPVMKYFGADPIKALFERLGIDKGECISHDLVNTAVRTAQEKIERKVGKDLPAHSAADWFKYNLPEK